MRGAIYDNYSCFRLRSSSATLRFSEISTHVPNVGIRIIYVCIMQVHKVWMSLTKTSNVYIRNIGTPIFLLLKNVAYWLHIFPSFETTILVECFECIHWGPSCRLNNSANVALKAIKPLRTVRVIHFFSGHVLACYDIPFRVALQGNYYFLELSSRWLVKQRMFNISHHVCFFFIITNLVVRFASVFNIRDALQIHCKIWHCK